MEYLWFSLFRDSMNFLPVAYISTFIYHVMVRLVF